MKLDPINDENGAPLFKKKWFFINNKGKYLCYTLYTEEKMLKRLIHKNYTFFLILLNKPAQ